MSNLIERQSAIDEWKNDFKGYVNSLNIPKDDYNGIMEYIDELPSAEPEPAHDIMDYTRYQVEWLESHNDIELEPELEKWIVRMLNDTAECYIKEYPETERETGEWVGIREYCNYLSSLDGKMYVPSGIGIPMKYCNLCWESVERGTNYCPNCGAKMEVDNNE